IKCFVHRVMEVNIEQTLRPLTLIFLIQPNNPKSYMKALRICSSLWGGIGFPIIPFYKIFPNHFKQLRLRYNTSSSYYSNIISNCNPDLIILDDEYNNNDLKFSNFRVVRKLSEIENIVDNHIQDDSAGIGIELIFKY